MPGEKSKIKPKKGKTIWLVFIGLICMGLLIALLLRGSDLALFNPKGYMAGEQRKLMLYSIFILLDIAIPTLIIFYMTAWKFRETNEKAEYDPVTHNKKLLVFSIWAVPTMFMLILASVMWPATHRLSPQKLIDNGAEPLTIQVVAMRWKWLFIYPEQQIAAVNFVQLPINTPVRFELTADETPMSSFWIPHLGGQLYAMTGHVNQLNLLADTAGDYTGISAEINGSGFAGMKFTARASTMENFNQWIQDVKQSPAELDSTQYQKLLAPTEYNQAAFYAKADPDVYANMLLKYSGTHYHDLGVE